MKIIIIILIAFIIRNANEFNNITTSIKCILNRLLKLELDSNNGLKPITTTELKVTNGFTANSNGYSGINNTESKLHEKVYRACGTMNNGCSCFVVSLTDLNSPLYQEGENKYLITAEHCVNSGEMYGVLPSPKIKPDNKCIIIRINDDWTIKDSLIDLAVYRIPKNHPQYDCITFINIPSLEDIPFIPGISLLNFGTPELIGVNIITSGIARCVNFTQWNQFSYVLMNLQTDNGNSGGPTVNHKGELVSVLQWGYNNNGYNPYSGGIAAFYLTSLLKFGNYPVYNSILDYNTYSHLKTISKLDGYAGYEINYADPNNDSLKSGDIITNVSGNAINKYTNTNISLEILKNFDGKAGSINIQYYDVTFGNQTTDSNSYPFDSESLINDYYIVNGYLWGPKTNRKFKVYSYLSQVKITFKGTEGLKFYMDAWNPTSGYTLLGYIYEEGQIIYFKNSVDDVTHEISQELNNDMTIYFKIKRNNNDITVDNPVGWNDHEWECNILDKTFYYNITNIETMSISTVNNIQLKEFIFSQTNIERIYSNTPKITQLKYEVQNYNSNTNANENLIYSNIHKQREHFKKNIILMNKLKSSKNLYFSDLYPELISEDLSDKNKKLISDKIKEQLITDLNKKILIDYV